MNVHTYHREKELDAERQSKGCQVSVEAQDKVDLVKRYRWTPGGDLEQSLVTYNGKHSALIYRRKKGCQVSVEAQEKDLLVIRQGRDEVRGERWDLTEHFRLRLKIGKLWELLIAEGHNYEENKKGRGKVQSLVRWETEGKKYEVGRQSNSFVTPL
jgi:hypothetical protein